MERAVTPSRRSFLIGATASLIAAPAIVRSASLMPVRGIVMGVVQAPYTRYGGGLYEELTAVTRRVFVPRLFVQVYDTNPAFDFLAGVAQHQ